VTAGSDALRDLLKPERLTAVVDIGANPIDGPPPYRTMLTNRLCTVVGFEPQSEALRTLNSGKSDFETYLPYAIGDGTKGVMKLCHAPGMSSLLTPETRVLNFFPGFDAWGRVVSEVPVETRTLDSISEITHLDYLKIDVQGSELSVFRNGSTRLSAAVAIHTEVSFIGLYANQPTFGEIDEVLRALGFIPHTFANLNKRMILPLQQGDNPFAALNQIVEGDMVYVRDFTHPDRMSAEQLKHLALVAHHCYASYDLAANCIHHLVGRSLVPSESMDRYLALLRSSGLSRRPLGKAGHDESVRC
jgi:FkbM family methyltransferase